jgi:hypothetical protein
MSIVDSSSLVDIEESLERYRRTLPRRVVVAEDCCNETPMWWFVQPLASYSAWRKNVDRLTVAWREFWTWLEFLECFLQCHVASTIRVPGSDMTSYVVAGLELIFGKLLQKYKSIVRCGAGMLVSDSFVHGGSWGWGTACISEIIISGCEQIVTNINIFLFPCSDGISIRNYVVVI